MEAQFLFGRDDGDYVNLADVIEYRLTSAIKIKIDLHIAHKKQDIEFRQYIYKNIYLQRRPRKLDFNVCTQVFTIRKSINLQKRFRWNFQRKCERT